MGPRGTDVKSLQSSAIAVCVLSLSALSPAPINASEPIPNCGATDRHFDPNEVPVAPVGSGTVYYVDAATGKDTNNGTSEATAFKTIGKAVNGSSAALGPGVTVRIKAGLYRERVNITKSGTASQRAVVGAFGNGPVIVDGSDAVTDWTQYSGQIYKATPGFPPDRRRRGRAAAASREQHRRPGGRPLLLRRHEPLRLGARRREPEHPRHRRDRRRRVPEHDLPQPLELSHPLRPHGALLGRQRHQRLGRRTSASRSAGSSSGGRPASACSPTATSTPTNTEIIKNELYYNFMRNWPRGVYKWGGWGMGAIVQRHGQRALPGQRLPQERRRGPGRLLRLRRNDLPRQRGLRQLERQHLRRQPAERPRREQLPLLPRARPHGPAQQRRHDPERQPEPEAPAARGNRHRRRELRQRRAPRNVPIQNNVIVNCRRGYNHYNDVSGSALKNVDILDNTILVAQRPGSAARSTLSGMIVGYNSGQQHRLAHREQRRLRHQSEHLPAPARRRLLVLRRLFAGTPSATTPGTTRRNSKPFLWGSYDRPST